MVARNRRPPDDSRRGKRPPPKIDKDGFEYFTPEDCASEPQPPPGYDGFCSSEVPGGTCDKPGHTESAGPTSWIACEEHAGGTPIHCGCVVLVFLLALGAGAVYFFFFR